MARSSVIDRIIDRYFLGGAVILLGLLRKTKRRMAHAEKVEPKALKLVGLLQPTAIGDTLHDISIAEATKRQHHDAKVVAVCSRTNRAAFELSEAIDECIEIDFRRIVKSLRTLRERRFDLFIDCSTWTCLTALYAGLSGSDVVIGYKSIYCSHRSLRHWMYDRVSAHRVDCHEFNNVKRLAECAGLNTKAMVPQVSLRTEPVEGIQMSGKRTLVLHLWAGGSQARFKSWPEKNWVDLIKRLRPEFDQIVLTGASRDRKSSQRVIENANIADIYNLSGRLDLLMLVGLLRDCTLLVTVDTGVLHLGVALEVPMISLHGPTSSRRWGPTHKLSVGIDSPSRHAGYINYGFEYIKGAESVMSHITVETVYTASVKMLGVKQGK